MIAGLVALAAATILWRRPADPGTREKGSGGIVGVYVNHDGVVRLGGADERVEPGDGLRFVYTARDERYLAVLSLDGAKHGSVYYPPGGVAARMPAGSGVGLPASTVLDDVLGVETVYGIS